MSERGDGEKEMKREEKTVTEMKINVFARCSVIFTMFEEGVVIHNPF